MIHSVFISEIAQRDFVETENYLIEHFSLQTGQKFALAFSKSVDLLKYFPRMFSRTDFQPWKKYELRSFRFMNYLGFYILLDDGTPAILRILHGRRDHERLIRRYPLKKYLDRTK